MFSKILIANRGEIACRVIRTARRMGIKTVAVYSDADDGALHMRMADEAISIGPAPAAQSYLSIDKIIDACKRTGADAVHPGYGFLSENVKFAEALKKAGIAFIGPDIHAVAAMGDKIESKKLAQKAGVSTVPGHLEAIKDVAKALRIAREIGYPIMLKASAGGGGKGMRIARTDSQVEEGFVSASNEARSAFGDERVFIERYIEEPRHIEIQVMGDKHGNIIHLGERECSIQRRHQKVIEEAPSPFLDVATRAAMGAQAVALAQAVNYSSAGTVEFIVDKNRNFYFLEMNTRLQVEHPVTELVTGLDLVELMIRVAAGEKLPLTQKDVRLDGWAMETRIYAEDPYRGFLPSTGRLSRCRFPLPSDTVRIDTGVEEGAEISPFYDPMIAKLCSWGKSRNEAGEIMARALDEIWIDGIGHNVNFLAALVGHERFKAGRLTTNFIAEEWPHGFQGVTLETIRRRNLAALAVIADEMNRLRVAGAQTLPLNGGGSVRPVFTVTMDGEDYEVESLTPRDQWHIQKTDGNDLMFRVGQDTVAVKSPWQPGQTHIRAHIDGQDMTVRIAAHRDAWVLTHRGAVLRAYVRTPRAAALARLMPKKMPPDLSKYLICPMPGLIVSIAVKAGEDVKAGQTLAIVEAMKMENVLRAERDGQIIAVNVKPGESVAVDQVLVEFA